MYKRLIFIIISCTLFVWLHGQGTNDILQKKIDSLKNKKATKKTSGDACCKTIEQFKNDIYKADRSGLVKKYNNKSVTAIIDTLTTMLNRAVSYGIGVNDKAAIKNKEVSKAPVNQSVVIILRVIDSNGFPRTPLEYHIKFDAANNPILYLNNAEDSSKSVSAVGPGNNKGLLILFKYPLAPEGGKDLGTQPQSNPVYYLFISGLLCVIGVTTYLYSRSFLKKLRSFGNNNFASVPVSDPVITGPAPEKEIPAYDMKQHANNSKQPASGLPEPLLKNESLPGIDDPVLTPETDFATVIETVKEETALENNITGYQNNDSPSDGEAVTPVSEEEKSSMTDNPFAGEPFSEIAAITEQDDVAPETYQGSYQHGPDLPDEEVTGSSFTHKQKYFFAEIMTTAGPRKKRMDEPGADNDLGEDVCGFVADGNELLIYLLDGASNNQSIRNPESKQEYFSSRLLAQCVANKLRLTFTTNREELSQETMLQAIRDVKEDWLRLFNGLPEKEKERIKNKIKESGPPVCSTTLLLARLSIDGQITVYRSGDSKLFMFQNSSEKDIRFEETTLAYIDDLIDDKLFFILKRTETNAFNIEYNEPRYEIVKNEGIHTIIVFSDGIGALTQQALQQNYAANSEEIRKEIMYQAQGTEDDKSICFMSIREK